MENGDIDLRAMLGVLHRQARLIAATVALITAIAVGFAFLQQQTYTAQALVMVDPSQKNLLEADDGAANAGSDNARVESEVEILRANSILLQVIDRLDLTGTAELGPAPAWYARLIAPLGFAPVPASAGDPRAETLANLRDTLTVARRGATYVIGVSVRSTNPATAALLANTIAQIYIDDQIASKIASVTATRDILQSQISQSRSAVIAGEAAFDAFITQNIAQIAQSTGRTDLAGIQRQIAQLVATRQQTAQLADTIQSYAGAGNWAALLTSVQSAALLDLERERTALADAIVAERPGSPVELDLRARLDRVQNSLATEASLQVTSLRSEIAAGQQTEDGLRQQLRTQVLSSGLPTDALTDLYQLQQNAEIARQHYQVLIGRVQDLDTQANLQIADSRIVSEALPPQDASSPSRLLIIGAALVLALGIGVALAFLRDNFVGGFTSEEQLAGALDIDIATAIPRAKAAPGSYGVADLIALAPLSAYSEAIRRTRTRLDQALDHAGPSSGRVLMVTSTAPHEGKSSTALALARAYAASGKRTLVIDCDLRQPALQRQVGVTPANGLREFLMAPSDSMGFQQFVVADPLSTITMVLASRSSDGPTDQLLAGPTFARLIAAARQHFDTIILDTPPIGPVVDALYAAPHADAVLFLTRWATTGQGEVRKAMASLRKAKRPAAPVLGVLSQQDAPTTAYHRQYASYYRALAE